ncbi:MAG: trigger factor [Pirellulaceae bacterium]|nr:trigger factor [Pirellulaceae bacterium]
MTVEDLTENETTEEKQKLQLTVDVKSPSACQRHVAVTISRDDVERYLSEAYDEMLPKAEVPGFRVGHAPRKIVEARFKKEVRDQIKGSLLMDAIEQVNEDEDFSAISEPDFDFSAVEVPEEGDMTFEFNIEVRPDFEMPAWQGLKIEKSVRDFTEDDIQSQLDQLLEKHAKPENYDGPAAANDYLTLDIVSSHDGQELNSATDCELRLRENLSFHDAKVEDFATLLTGTKVGDSKTAKATISKEASNKELREKEVEITFTLKGLKKHTLPEINAELLAQFGSHLTDEDSLKEALRSELENQLSYHQQRQVRKQITDLLTESANWELPPEMLKRQANRELERATMELRSSGFTNEQIAAYENEFRQNSMASAATALKEHFILERIAEEKEIDAQEQDYDLEVSKIAMQGGQSPRQVKAQIEKRGLMDSLRNQIVESKVIDLITAEAAIEEIDYDLPKADTAAANFALSGKGEVDIPEIQE